MLLESLNRLSREEVPSARALRSIGGALARLQSNAMAVVDVQKCLSQRVLELAAETSAKDCDFVIFTRFIHRIIEAMTVTLMGELLVPASTLSRLLMALSSPLPLIVAAPSPTALRANRRLLMLNGLLLLGRSMSLISTAPCWNSLVS